MSAPRPGKGHYFKLSEKARSRDGDRGRSFSERGGVTGCRRGRQKKRTARTRRKSKTVEIGKQREQKISQSGIGKVCSEGRIGYTRGPVRKGRTTNDPQDLTWESKVGTTQTRQENSVPVLPKGVLGSKCRTKNIKPWLT